MIKHEKGKWVLYTKDGSKVLGRHDTEADALAQERAVEIAKHAREAARGLVSRDAVARVCTSCAEVMDKKGLKAVRLERLAESPKFLRALEAAQVREADKIRLLAADKTQTAESIDQDEGFFTYCKEKPIGPGTDEFCAWLHDKLLGHWPGQDRHAGGPGSGNFGHAGRPGEVGGSSSEGGGGGKGEYVTANIGKYGPKHDYTGAHVLDSKGRLATITKVYHNDNRGYWMAKLRRFNGEDAGEQTLITLKIIPLRGENTSARSASVRLASAGHVQEVMVDGRPHLKVPVVALVEGVLTASNSPGGKAERVLAADLAETVDQWEGMPFVMDHPKTGGRRLSARDPEIKRRYAFGHVTNARMSKDGRRLLMDALLDPERAKAVGPDAERLMARARSGGLVDVSVGVFVETENGEGLHGGKRYAATWKNIVPDHLAGMPEGKPGACSLEMGCGLPRAASAQKEERKMSVMERVIGAVKDVFRTAEEPTGPSDSELRTALQDALYAEGEEDLSVWVQEIYQQDGMFVYSVSPANVVGDQRFYRRSYTADADGNVTLGDDAEEVKPHTEYETINQAEETQMSEENRAASGASDDDSLEEDGALDDTEAQEAQEEEGMTQEELDAAVQAKIDAVKAEAKADAQKQVEEVRAASAKEIAELRTEVEKSRPIVAEHQAREAARRAELVAELKTCSAFDEAALTGMATSVLEGLKKTVDKNKVVPDFSGRSMPRAAAASTGIPPAPSVFAKSN